MKNKAVIPFLLIFSNLFFACNTPKSGFSAEQVAQVGEKVLYRTDLEQMLPSSLSPQDSIEAAQAYIHRWIKRQLLVQKAKQELSVAELEQKVREYEEDLFLHTYENYYVQKNLDTLVSEQEIEQYYQAHTDDFVLKQHLIKGFFAKFPKDTPNLSQFVARIKTERKGAQENFEEFCHTHAIEYVFQKDWVSLHELTNQTPLNNLSELAQSLKSNVLVQVSDQDYTYVIKASDLKQVNQLAPLAFVSQQVKQMILNMRRVKLKEELGNQLFKNSSPNQDYEIFQ